MAKLYFFYGAMGSSKSATLLMSAHTYEVQGKRVLLLTNSIDSRSGVGTISSRVGIKSYANTFSPNDNLFELIVSIISDNKVSCIFIDEAQFLTREQVFELSDIVDILDIPILCYGLKTDFKGRLFEGSQALLELSDSFREIKTTCYACERKATHNLRTLDGIPTNKGEQIQIGDEEYYPMCRKHYKEYIKNKTEIL